MAADIAPVIVPSMPGPVVVAPAPVIEWSGFYVGAMAGIDISGFCRPEGAGCPPNTRPPYNDPAAPYLKAFVGGFAGMNIQRQGRLVFGFDAMAGTDLPLPSFFESTTIQIQKGFLRGRAGFALSNHVLVYGTAGLAVMRHYWENATPQAGWGFGWTVGAGAEVKTDGGLGLRLDYAFHRIYGLDQAPTADLPDPPNGIPFNSGGHTLTIGIFKLFGGG